MTIPRFRKEALSPLRQEEVSEDDAGHVYGLDSSLIPVQETQQAAPDLNMKRTDSDVPMSDFRTFVTRAKSDLQQRVHVPVRETQQVASDLNNSEKPVFRTFVAQDRHRLLGPRSDRDVSIRP